ncbi:MAG: tetratricopeptide repeat protein [Chlamydiae bacterium]|nr:tetratricopeptide repeat protein [Chlamydiota bacterium]MBI3276159.1 tetratricopeptide repeat protein [Chlamydiota bacterium]
MNFLRLGAFALLLLNLFSAFCFSEENGYSPILEHRMKANEMVQMLREERYSEVDAFLQSTHEKHLQTVDGSTSLNLLYDYISGHNELTEEILKRWRDSSPQSHFAYTVSGYFYIHYAWKARGSEWADKVASEMWPLFKARILLAKFYLEQAYQMDSSDPNSSTFLITVCRGLSLKRKIMENYFQRAIQADPTFFDAYFEKLQYLMPKWQGSKKKMFRFAMRAALEAPQHSAIPLVLAYAHDEMADRSGDRNKYLSDPKVWNDIEAVFEKFFETSPKCNSRRTMFAQLAIDAGKLELAKKHLDLVISYYPKSYTPYYERGRYFMVLKEYQKAIEDFTKAIEMFPSYEEAYTKRGVSHVRLGEYEAALNDFSKAIELDPRNEYGLSQIGSIYLSKKDYKQAINFCSKAVEIDDKDTLAFSSRAYAYSMINDFQKALKDYQRVMEITDQHEYIFSNMGYVYVKLEQPEKALEYFKKAIQYNPDDQYAQRWFSSVKQRLSKSGEVKRVVEVKKLTPSFFDILRVILMVLLLGTFVGIRLKRKKI